MNPRVEELLKAQAGQGVFATGKVTLHHFVAEGARLTFCSNMRRDPIQRSHRKGRFYEQEELGLLRALVGTGKRIVDIGANIGNHTVYFAKIMQAERVVSFEPNPLAYETLLINVMLNGVTDQVDLSHIGLGLSDKAAGGFGMEERERNLGAAGMIEGSGNIQVIRADSVLDGFAPDLIKLDVEGMELQVLEGLGAIPERDKPLMYVEVNNENADGFVAWRDANGFETVHTIQRYRTSVYHLITHESRADELAQKLNAILEEKENA